MEITSFARFRQNTQRSKQIALFTVSFSHLHYNVIQRAKQFRAKMLQNMNPNCLDFIVVQMSRVNREKGYSQSGECFDESRYIMKTKLILKK